MSGYSGYSGLSSSQAADAGTSVEIVDVLAKFGRAVPIEFLARQLGRRPGGLMEDLAHLQDRGAVKINRDDQTVELLQSGPQKSGFGKLLQKIFSPK